MSKLFSTFRRPKWRHGALSALLLGGLVAACALLCVGVSRLEDAYGWRLDMSFNGYATTGEETKKALDALENDVTLYLLYQGNDEDVQLLEVLKRYERLSPRVTVRETDIAKNPGVLTRFRGTMTDAVATGSVIVSCEETGRYEVLSQTNFVTQGYDIEQGTFTIAGLAYEKQLTEAISYVTQNNAPTLGLLTGHGELSADALGNLPTYLKSNGYQSRSVDLKAGDTLKGLSALLVLSPTLDLTDSELKALTDYAEGGGSFFFTRDFTDPTELTNFRAFLRSYGIAPLAGVVVADERAAATYDGEPIYLLPSMNSVDFTLPLIANRMTALTMPGACAFSVQEAGDNQLATAIVLQSGQTAYLRDPSDGNTSIAQQPTDPTGPFALGVYCQRMHQSSEISRLFVLGCSATVTEDYMYEHTYASMFLLQLMGELAPDTAVSLDIAASAAFHPALTVGSRAIGRALIALLPLLVLAVALCVLLPRRRR